jgi:hypothetical protein
VGHELLALAQFDLGVVVKVLEPLRGDLGQHLGLVDPELRLEFAHDPLPAAHLMGVTVDDDRDRPPGLLQFLLGLADLFFGGLQVALGAFKVVQRLSFSIPR